MGGASEHRADAVSWFENRSDVQPAFLHECVQTLRGKLHSNSTLPEDASLLMYLKAALDDDVLKEDDLAGSILHEDPLQRDIVLSVRPAYSHQILAGKKTVELRRRFPRSTPPGRVAYIYSTSPDRAITGIAQIVDVIRIPVSDLWDRYAHCAFVERKDFDTYFEGLVEGFALKLANARPLTRRLNLSELRERFDFEPPQSFLYAKPFLRRALQDEQPSLSH